MRALEFAKQLVAFDSVSSKSNAPVAAWTARTLKHLGFEVEELAYDQPSGVQKVCLVAKRGPGHGGIAYCCHNDVVPVDGWAGPHGGPFDSVVADGRLWGRGACDMKGSAASALAAIESIPIDQQKHPIYFVATSDEEVGMAGARLVDKSSQLFDEMVEYQTVGLIGEPTLLEVVNSHKGGCYLSFASHGRAAHSSTAEGLNANWSMIPFLSYLKEINDRCQNDPALQNGIYSPPTLSMNIVLENQPAATNITVASTTCRVFLRPMPEVAWEKLVDEIVSLAKQCGVSVGPIAQLNPMYTPADRPFVQDVLQILGKKIPQTVCYATDGGCFQRLADLVVIGPGSIDQAHTADEWISLEQLEKGTEVFAKILRYFACDRN